ncbi:MAG: hypothetical protein [Caudoviricetes sp.]|nr:MAG: hypothetical protein [Caudoviricetes sp.]
MKHCSVFCYYEGMDDAGQGICSGNHTCDIKYEIFASASEYVKNTRGYLMSELKPQYANLARIVLKQVTIFPGE